MGLGLEVKTLNPKLKTLNLKPLRVEARVPLKESSTMADDLNLAFL